MGIKNNRNPISDWIRLASLAKLSSPNHDTLSRGNHQPWLCSEGLTERISDNFPGVSSKCLRWLVIESILSKRGKERATSSSGFSFIWCVMLLDSFVTHSKLNFWDRDCLAKASPFQWQLLIPWLSTLEQQDWVRSNVDTTRVPKIQGSTWMLLRQCCYSVPDFLTLLNSC